MRVLALIAALLFSSEASAEPVKVLLSVSTKGPKGLERLLQGGTLASGREFEMQIEVDRASYLYVVQFFPDGTSQVLFPAEGEVQIEPNEKMRLPPEGYWFKLDDVVGDENIYVIASERPLGQADRETAAMLDEVRKSGTQPKKKAAQKKATGTAKVPSGALAQAEVSGLTMRTRGVLLVKETKEAPMQVQADRDGVAVVLFAFKHAARNP